MKDWRKLQNSASVEISNKTEGKKQLKVDGQKSYPALKYVKAI